MEIRVKKSLKLIVLLLSSIMIATASATAYVTLQWQITATVSDHPNVCFVKWDDGTLSNTFTYSITIFPNVTTVEENATYGIYNRDTTAAHTVYFRLASENTNSTDVALLRFKVYNSTVIKYEENITDFDNPDTSWSTPISLDPDTKYAIYIEVKGSSTATAGHKPQFVFEIKVENP